LASESDMTGTILSRPVMGAENATPIAPPPAVDLIAQTDQSSDPDSPREIKSRRRLVDDPRLPAWLASTITHTIALLILALMSYGGESRQASLTIKSRRGAPAEIASFQIAKSKQPINHHSANAEQPVNVAVDISPATVPRSPLDAKTTATELTKSQIAMIATGGSQSEAKVIQLPGGGLSGRTPEGRTTYGQRYGATPQSEAAVDLALRWIADHQRPNGSWSFNLQLDPCQGRCRHSKAAGDTPTPTTGATGLALLAFLGAGHTHQTGPYADNIRRGIYYLRSVAGETQFGFDFQQGSMYGHGIAQLALGEALSMTRTEDGLYDTDLFHLVERGSYFTVVAQHANGSWGYIPGSPGDTTLTGWQVLSLVAARRNGIQLRSNTFPNAKDFLRNVVADENFDFGYKGPPGEPTTTAIALTLLLYLGQTPGFTPFDQSLDRLADRGPTLTNVYHDYYGTLALHHTRHPQWDRWNTKLRDHLVAAQAKQGHERGSWHFKDKWGDIGGRLYTTAMCTMILEVYYRYLPMYEKIEEFPL
jgi:hypothetical protein